MSRELYECTNCGELHVQTEAPSCPNLRTEGSKLRMRHFGFATEERAQELLESLQEDKSKGRLLAQTLFDYVVHPLLEQVYPFENREPHGYTIVNKNGRNRNGHLTHSNTSLDWHVKLYDIQFPEDAPHRVAPLYPDP